MQARSALGSLGRGRSGAEARSMGALYSLWVVAVIIGVMFVFGSLVWNAASVKAPSVVAQVTVKQGDTLWALASRHGDPTEYILKRIETLAKINNIRTNSVLYEGQTLVVPVGNPKSDLYHGERYASEQIAN